MHLSGVRSVCVYVCMCVTTMDACCSLLGLASVMRFRALFEMQSTRVRSEVSLAAERVSTLGSYLDTASYACHPPALRCAHSLISAQCESNVGCHGWGGAACLRVMRDNKDSVLVREALAKASAVALCADSCDETP